MPHGITKLKIKNYCSCKDLSVPLSRVTPLVGYNNAGKSNILSALTWLLKKSTLDETKFYDVSEPVTVVGKIEGITAEILAGIADNHRAAVSKYLVGGSLVIRRKQLLPSCAAKDVILEVRNMDIADDDSPDAWKKPGGIDNAIKDLFPEPIVIKAMDDASGDVNKFGKTNTIGRLISEIIEPIEAQHGNQIRNALNSVGKRLAYDGEERAAELDEFDEQATANVAGLFPGLSLKLHVPTPNIEEIFKASTFKVFEQGYEDSPRDLESLGHGAQRSIQMALVRQLAEIRMAVGAQTRTTLLLIDEPELYLHPQAVEYVRAALNVLSVGGYQVVFTTHSAQMIPVDDVKNALMVYKNIEEGTQVRTRLDNAVQQVIEDAASQVDVLFSLTNSNQILFSEIVLLSEGKTERKLLPRIFERLANTTLAERKIALIEQQGVDNTSKSMSVLNVLGIPSKALVDLDFAFRGAITTGLLNEDDVDIAACKNVLSRISEANNIRLCEQGLPRKGNGKSASDGFKILARQGEISDNLESIHQKLLQRNIWVWTRGAIEEHLGNDAKNERHLARFAHRLSTEEPSELLEDFDTVNQFCAWLVE